MVLTQFIAAGVQPFAKRLGTLFPQGRAFGLQVADDQRVAIARVPGQRQDHGKVVAGCREASRDMHHRFEQLHLIEHGLLAAQVIQIAIEPGLTLANQPCQADGGAHIGERVVRLQMLQTIGHAEPLQLERDATILLRPHQPFGAQRIGRAHQIDQVPTAVAALPFARIGIMEVAIQAVARYLVIETQGVVAGAASTRQRQLLMQQMDELGFAQPLAGERLGRDPGHQASGRMRQDVVTETAVDVQGLANLFQRLVGADAGDL